jgi:crossover junction endodeoxyribonuclease RuvC
MRIIGVDPGLRVTGYGAIDVDGESVRLLEAGVITPKVDQPLEARLGSLHVELSAVIRSLEPDVMVIEALWSAYKNPTTAIIMGHARGVLCLAAHDHRVPVEHLGHSMVKRALVGSGSAKKEQVKQMVVQLLRLRSIPAPNDVSDALGLALAFANIDRVNRRFARREIAL